MFKFPRNRSLTLSRTLFILLCSLAALSAQADVSIQASTFIGVVGRDTIGASAISTVGDIYLAGDTQLSDRWAFVAEPINTSAPTARTFVVKVNADLSSIGKAILLEGFVVKDMVIAPNGELYIAGDEFRTGISSSCETSTVKCHVTVIRLDSSLTSILGSITFGGSGSDELESIALLPNGSVVVAGITKSTDFPTTSGVFDASCGEDGLCDNGRTDGFIAVIDSTLVLVERATYVGGSGNDKMTTMAVDNNGDILVAGRSSSLSLLASFPNAYQTNLTRFGIGGFIGKFDAELADMSAATFWHNGFDSRYNIYDIAIVNHEVVITGSAGAGIPTLPDAFQPNYHHTPGCQNCPRPSDAYIAIFDGSLTKVLRATYFGAEQSQIGLALSSDAAGNIFVAGSTDTDSSIPLFGAFDDELTGSGDIFVAGFNNSLSTLLASSYLGGDKVGSYAAGESVSNLIAAPNGDIVVIGTTDSPSFPTTDGAYDNECGGDRCDFSTFGEFRPLRDGFITALHFDTTDGAGSGSQNSNCVAASISDSFGLIFPNVKAGAVEIGAHFSFVEQIGNEYRFRLSKTEVASASSCPAIFEGENLLVPSMMLSGGLHTVSFKVVSDADNVFGFSVNSIAKL
jgi:hypothetical protein